VRIHLWGTDFRRSTPEMRQKLTLNRDRLKDELSSLLGLGFSDIIYVATCNRIEFYTTAPDVYADSRPLWIKLLTHLGLTEEDYYRGFHLEGKGAFRHLLRVASSLESLVVGEPQILGQLKESLRFVKANGLPLDGTTERAFNLAFETAKLVRTQTSIGEKSTSVASLALNQLKRLEGEFPLTKVVLVGRSPMNQLVAQWMKKNRPQAELLWVNRNVAALADLEEAAGVPTQMLSDFLAAPGDFSHLFTATASREPIFTGPFFEKLRGEKKLIFDLAEPADVEMSGVAQTHSLILRMKDFETEAKKNALARADAVADAEKLISQAMREFLRERKETPLLKEFSSAVTVIEENLTCMLQEISVEVPENLHDRIKKWSEKLVKKNLHLSREHLKEVIHRQTGGSHRE